MNQRAIRNEHDPQSIKALPATALQPKLSGLMGISCPVSTSTSEHGVLVGQSRAVNAITDLLSTPGRYAHGFMINQAGIRGMDLLAETLRQQNNVLPKHNHQDWFYVVNPDSANRPICINVDTGQAPKIISHLIAWLQTAPKVRGELTNELQQAAETSKRLKQYIERVSSVMFEDLPGSEFATIIVSQNDTSPAFHLCDQVTESSLFGRIQLQSEQGTIHSGLHLIEPGMLLKANGGTLVIAAEELLQNESLWRRLKHVLKSSQFVWPQPGDAHIAAYYEPEPIPVQLKVILWGDRDIYAQLREYDRDFDNLFPFLVDVANHFSLSSETDTAAPYFDYLCYVVQEANVLPLNQTAWLHLLQYSARLTEYQHELSLDTIALMQFLREANVQAQRYGASEMTAEHCQAVIKARKQRDGYLAELNKRAILTEQVYIQTRGEEIGQVNGLTVITMGGSDFGEPSRITATVHYGDGDIIDIERKSELSGNIHTKGVMILTAYLANLFARDEPMSLSATIVFEQSYHEVDGDSASLAELCCLLSALAEQPLRQGLALTGAIDQFGRVQAIGAVNEKINGYFDVCQARGLTGEQGVIIPAANLSQLNLSDEIVEAVAAGSFQVFAVETVAEAIQLLMQQPENMVFDRIKTRLHELQHGRPRESFWNRLF